MPFTLNLIRPADGSIGSSSSPVVDASGISARHETVWTLLGTTDGIILVL